MSEDKKPLDPTLTQLGRALLGKVVAVAADRGMPVTIGGKPMDAQTLHRQANQAILESASELTGRALQSAAAFASDRFQGEPGEAPAEPTDGARRPFGGNRRHGGGARKRRTRA